MLNIWHGDNGPFFVIVVSGRFDVDVENGLCRLQMHERNRSMLVHRCDPYVSVADPDALADEFLSRDVTFSEQLTDTEDGLRGFEVQDVDGYVLFFGRPCENLT